MDKDGFRKKNAFYFKGYLSSELIYELIIINNM